MGVGLNISFFVQHERKIQIERTRLRYNDNIKLDPKYLGRKVLDWINIRSVAGLCKCGN